MKTIVTLALMFSANCWAGIDQALQSPLKVTWRAGHRSGTASTDLASNLKYDLSRIDLFNAKVKELGGKVLKNSHSTRETFAVVWKSGNMTLEETVKAGGSCEGLDKCKESLMKFNALNPEVLRDDFQGELSIPVIEHSGEMEIDFGDMVKAEKIGNIQIEYVRKPVSDLLLMIDAVQIKSTPSLFNGIQSVHRVVID